MSNFQITPGTGTIIATDVGGGGENYQKLKLIDATAGATQATGVAANPLQVSLEFTSANTVPLRIDGSAVTQPVSGTVSALQSGAWNITNISGTVSLPTGAATESTLAAIKLDLDAFTFVASALLIDGSGVTQPISVVTLPLPTGAATETTLAAVKDDVDNLDVALSTRATEATLANIKSDLDKFTFVASNLLVDGSGVLQPVAISQVGLDNNVLVTNFPSSQTVNGTVAATQSGTWTVALSSGAIEIGTVDQGSPNTLANAWPFELTDGTNILGVAAHPVRIDPTGTTTQPVSGTVSVSNFPVTQPVSGTVTANAGTGNFTVVQATASSLNATVSGTVAVTQATGTNLHTVVDSGSITVANASIAVTQSTSPWIVSLASTTITGTVAATQSGAWNITNISGTITLPTGAATSANQTNASQKTQIVDGSGNVIASTSNALNVEVTNFPSTQPISGTVSVSNFPATQAVTQSGTWTVGLTTESIEIGKVDQGTANTLANAWPVELTDGTNVLGVSAHPVRIDPTGTTTQPVSGTVTANQGTSPWVVSGTVTANAGTGSFTVAQATGTNLHTVVDSGSITVANASLPVTQSGTWNITNISGTVSLPTGAATSAKQPALGTAGTASSDVITVQGIASMTALKVDGSAVTQPVSGTIIANAGTGSFTVAQATGTNLHVVVDAAPTTTVTGTVTANIGTTNGLALDATISALEVAQASTTAGQKGILQLGAVTTGSPTYATTQTSALSLTTAGALRVDASATTQPISGSVTVANATIAVTQSGTWNLNNISGTISLPTGASTETTLASLNGKVTAVNTGAVTISTSLPAGTNVIGHVIADSGSTTAVTGNVSVVQTTAANLNATIVGTVTANQGTANATPWNENISQIGGNTIATAATGIIKVGVTDSSGNSLTSTIDGSQRGLDSNIINIQDNMGTGTIVALNGSVTALTNGSSTINFQVTGTWSATLTIQGSVDGTTWNVIVGDVDITDTIESTITTNTFVSIACGGFQQVRLSATAFTSGTVSIAWEASLGSSISEIYNTNPASLQATVTQLAITKGTQGTTGVTTQNLKDAGRSYITFTADAIAGVTAEALVTFTLNKNGTATASQTNYTITNGKTLRIQVLSASVQAGAAAGEWVRAKLRINTAGATIATSPLLITIEAGSAAAATATAGSAGISIPDGLEIAGNGTITIGLSHISSATTNAESITLIGYEY